MVQEYGRYFNMPTCCLRGGCLTGPNHSGVELHGFLSYLIQVQLEGREYKVYGYKGKQVRDNIHSEDVPRFMFEFSPERRAAAKSTIWAAAKRIPARFSKPFRMAEEITGTPAGIDLCGRESHRRPHLLLQRPAQDEVALSGLGHHQRPAADICRDRRKLDRRVWPV